MKSILVAKIELVESKGSHQFREHSKGHFTLRLGIIHTYVVEFSKTIRDCQEALPPCESAGRTASWGRWLA